MTRALAWITCIGLSTAMLFITGTRAARAHSAASAARQDLTTITTQAEELVRLRAAKLDFPDRPEGGLAGKVSAAMTRAGLPNTALQSLSPEAQSAISSNSVTPLTRQRATLTLHNLSLPQIGRFLDAWRTTEPDWTVSSIDLTPITSKDAAALGTDLPLRAVITIEGLFKQPARIPALPASPHLGTQR